MIEFQQVHKTYRVAGREVPALRPTDLCIEAGEVFGLIGHSGAGKSTLLRLINRLEEPSGGRIRVNGEDVTALSAAEVLERATFVAGEQRVLFTSAEIFGGDNLPNLIRSRRSSCNNERWIFFTNEQSSWFLFF